jgi:hypothetical protein
MPRISRIYIHRNDRFCPTLIGRLRRGKFFGAANDRAEFAAAEQIITKPLTLRPMSGGARVPCRPNFFHIELSSRFELPSRIKLPFRFKKSLRFSKKSYDRGRIQKNDYGRPALTRVRIQKEDSKESELRRTNKSVMSGENMRIARF